MRNDLKYIKWLNSQTDIWVNNGLISSEQGTSINDFYGDNNFSKTSNTLTIILSALGSILVGMGIILLIAKNWDMFSSSTKLIISTLPFLSGLSIAVYMLKKEVSRSSLQSIGVFISLSIIAGLALVGQTYNSVAPIENLYLFSALLSLPFIYVLESTLAAILYIFLISGYTFSFSNFDPYILLSIDAILISALIPYVKQIKAKASKLELDWLFSFAALYGLFSITTVPYNQEFLSGTIFMYGFILLMISKYNIENKLIKNLGIILLLITSFSFTFSSSWEYFDIDTSFKNLQLFIIINIPVVILMYKDFKNHTINSYNMLPLIPILYLCLSLLSQGHIFSIIFLWMFNILFLIVSIYIFVRGYKIKNSSSQSNFGLVLMLMIIYKWFFVDIQVSFLIRSLVFIILGISFLTSTFIINKKTKGVSNEK